MTRLRYRAEQQLFTFLFNIPENDFDTIVGQTNLCPYRQMEEWYGYKY